MIVAHDPVVGYIDERSSETHARHVNGFLRKNGLGLNDPIRFSCKGGCGRCCTAFYINVTDADVNRITKETGRSPQDFVDLCPRESIIDQDEDCNLKMQTGTYRIILAERMGRCIFQLEDRRCEIYESRPLPCRIFPFDMNGEMITINDVAIGVCKGLSSKGHPIDEDNITLLESRWSLEVNRFTERIREWNDLFGQGKVDGTWQALLSFFFSSAQ